MQGELGMELGYFNLLQCLLYIGISCDNISGALASLINALVDFG